MKNKSNVFITKLAISDCTDNSNLCFGEKTTYVSMQDEGGSYFLELIQEPNDFNGGTMHTIRLDFGEIGAIYKAMKILERNAKKYQEIENPSSFKYSENSAIISNKP